MCIMEEKVIIMKTRNLLPLIEKLIKLENLEVDSEQRWYYFMTSNEMKDFEKFIDEKIQALEKPVKYVFRSR